MGGLWTTKEDPNLHGDMSELYLEDILMTFVLTFQSC